MTYNIHPLFVHFPIALLFLYSLIKILPLKKICPNVAWKHIEIILLIVGVAGGMGALYTGGIARHLINPNRQLVSMHSLFASISMWLYGGLLFGELLYFINPIISQKFQNLKINSTLSFIESILTSPLVSSSMAILGLIAIITTGMLGGIMVYGLSADPLAPTILHLLSIKL